MNLEVILSYISLTLNTSCSIMKILTYRISTDNWEQILSAFRKKRPHSVSINNFYRINSFVRQSLLYLSWYGFQKISRCALVVMTHDNFSTNIISNLRNIPEIALKSNWEFQNCFETYWMLLIDHAACI